jgi:hypothetical protein
MNEDPASRSLRSGSGDDLLRDFVAELVDGERPWSDDPRDVMVILAPFHDCARRLGLDVAATELTDRRTASGSARMHGSWLSEGKLTFVHPQLDWFALKRLDDEALASSPV